MAPNPRVARAFRAMRALGIPEEKTKPVLKNLLKVYEKNWELIEEENYRVLADAIFDDESEVTEQKKKLDDAEKPLKQPHVRHQDDQASPSCLNPNTSSSGSLLKVPKLEVNELPKSRPEPQSPIEIIETGPVLRTGSHPVSPPKQAGLPTSSMKLKDEPLTESLNNGDALTENNLVKEPDPTKTVNLSNHVQESSNKTNALSAKIDIASSSSDLAPDHNGQPPLNTDATSPTENGFEENNHTDPLRSENDFEEETENEFDETTDIAKGEERVIISLVNSVNTERPPSFIYIPKSTVFQNAYVNISLARVKNENCCSCFGNCLTSSTPCQCALKTGGEFAYTDEGTIKEDFLDKYIQTNRDPEKCRILYCKECPLEKPLNEGVLGTCKGHLGRRFIKECWLKCGCYKKCGNRVVQSGFRYKLQVFMTPGGKGWGLRALEDLPKGAFVCEFVGEVLTCKELLNRVSQSSKEDEFSYPVFLDAEWGEENDKMKEDEALCLDATYYGNVARFINHRCFDPNLIEIPVEVENPDRHFYHVAFFTTRKVKALEELTRDYGINFDDDYLVKAFECQCGSTFCRDIKGSIGSRKRKCAED